MKIFIIFFGTLLIGFQFVLYKVFIICVYLT